MGAGALAAAGAAFWVTRSWKDKSWQKHDPTLAPAPPFQPKGSGGGGGVQWSERD